MSKDSKINEIKYEKSPDYMTTYADGIVVQLSDEVSRLMFYQVDADLTDASNDVKEEKILRFEVRLPKDVLIQIAENIVNTTEAQNEAYQVIEGIEDEILNRRYEEFNAKMNRTFFDPSIQLANTNTVDQIHDEFEDLVGKAQREKGIDPSKDE